MQKELLLFVPGFTEGPQGSGLKKLSDGIKSYCDHNGMPYEAMDLNLSDDGARMQRIRLSDREIEIKEVYWVDQMPHLTDQSIRDKVLDGLSMIYYWLSSCQIWKIAGSNKFFLFNIIFTVVLVLMWYLSTLGMALEVVEDKYKEWIPQIIREWLVGVNGWVVMTLIIAVFPVNTIFNVTYATKRYLQNMHSLFHEVYGRVSRSFRFGESAQAYDRVTVVAHSFGVVVAAEALNGFEPRAQTLRFITLGTPLHLIGARSPRVKGAAQKVAQALKVAAWYDFYSKQDWMSSGASLTETYPKYHPFEITSQVAPREMISGGSHDLYFHDWDVMKTLLAKLEPDKVQP